MKYLLFVQLLSFVLLAHAQQTTLSEACAGLKKLSSCKFKFSIPTGFTVKTKEVSEKTLNECKTKKKEKQPCPTKKKPSKTCETMVCVPGYDITKKRVPTGLKVTTEQVDLCETVRKVLGQSEGDTFIKSSDAICKCFPRLDQLNATAQFNALSQGIISPLNSKVADELLSIQTCLQNGGFNLENNLSEVTGSIKSGSSFTNVQAFEMDESTLAKLIAGTKSCQKGTCNSTLIAETIQYVFRMSSDANSIFRGSLSSWQAMLSNIKSISINLNDRSTKLTSYAASMQAQLDKINEMCMKLGSCKGPHVSYFLQQVEKNIAASNYLGALPSNLTSDLGSILQQIQDASNQTGSLGDDAVVALFKDNKVNTTADLFQLLPSIKYLKDISIDIKTRVDPIREFLPGNTSFARSASAQQDQLVSIPSKDIERELGIGVDWKNHELIGKISTMRQLIWTHQNEWHLSRFIGYLGSIQGPLNELSWKNGRFSIETKLISYKLWSTLPTMAMPCSGQKNETYKDSGFEQVFSYPEYFECMVNGTTAAFPDRQMGYLRITS